MAQQIRVLVVHPGILSLSPRIHVVEENYLLGVLLWPPWRCGPCARAGISFKERNEQLGMVAHAFDVSTQGSVADGVLGSRPAWSTPYEFQASQGYIVRPCLKNK